MLHPFVQHTLDIARSYLGTREIGHTNTGVQVDKWLADVGLDPGNPWCAAYLYGTANDAAKALSIQNPVLCSGSCEADRVAAKEHGILFQSPQVGDSFLRLGMVDGVYRAHHTGWVEQVNGDGSIVTIAGNTNSDGSREGYEVARLTEPVNSTLVFARWVLRCDPTPKPWTLLSPDGRPICPLVNIAGSNLVRVRDWGAFFGFQVGWTNGHATFDGQPVPAAETILGGSAYAPVRPLATAANLGVDFDAAKQTVTLKHPAP